MSIIELIKYILLGFIQGVTEVLPISSSGHVAIFQQLLNLKTDEGLLFLVLINVGSLVAIFIHFHKMLISIFTNCIDFIFRPSTREDTKEGFAYAIKIIIGIIPSAFIGYFLSHSVDVLYQEHYLLMVGAGLLFTSTVLYLVRNKSFVNGRQTVTYQDTLFIGIFQSLAILPGISRSGVTTSSGLFRKMSMETSLNFSFMLYIPLSIGSFIRYLVIINNSTQLSDLGIDPTNSYQIFYYIAAMITSIFATIFALKVMFRLFRKGKLLPFALYTFFVGLIVFILGLSISF